MGLKSKKEAHDDYHSPALKSDQNGIEMKPQTTTKEEKKRLKSDQNGIEILQGVEGWSEGRG